MDFQPGSLYAGFVHAKQKAAGSSPAAIVAFTKRDTCGTPGQTRRQRSAACGSAFHQRHDLLQPRRMQRQREPGDGNCGAS